MLPLAARSILILEDDATTASELVRAIEAAGAETLYAATVFEALQRLDQFSVSAAVIDHFAGAPDRDRIAARLCSLGIPFCLHAKNTPSVDLGAPTASRIDLVVPLLSAMLAP